MDRHGLPGRYEPFSIEKNSYRLYINSRALPDEVKVKCRRYFSPGSVSIKRSRNGLSSSAGDVRGPYRFVRNEIMPSG